MRFSGEKKLSKTLHKIDEYTGSQLMRLWGVASWPQVEGNYYLWSDCGVFVVINRVGYVELHMAMKDGERHWCRDAVTDVLTFIGDREVWAVIREERKRVCNLARKFGFVETWKGPSKVVGAGVKNIILMKRFSYGRCI
ncbi:hypothetical protein [Vibrio proteolyticus]